MTKRLDWEWEALDPEDFGNTGYSSHGYVVEKNGADGWWVWDSARENFYRSADSMSEACSIAEADWAAEIIHACRELTAMGLIVDSGKRRSSPDGEPEIVWRLATEEEKFTARGLEPTEAKAFLEAIPSPAELLPEGTLSQLEIAFGHLESGSDA